MSSAHVMIGRRLRGGALALIVLFACTFGLAAQEDQSPRSYISRWIDARVVVGDPDAVSILISDFAEQNGGYFVTRSETMVTLRLPNGVLGRFRIFLSAVADDTLRFDPSSIDLRTELIRVDAGITSRSEALGKIFVYLESADISATLDFELELRALNGELESLRGQKIRILNDIEYAYVSVALSSTESEIPVNRPSSFAWINRVDLYRLVSEAGL